MTRQFAVASAVTAVVLGLAACQPAAREEAAPAADAGPAAAASAQDPGAIPASYDWAWRAHGGSADLDFGDGDWAEGVSLLHFSCLPNSRKVEVSWGYPKPATLSSGGTSAELQADASVETSAPVIVALRLSGAIDLTLDGSTQSLVGKAAGKKAVEEFFAYCTTPLKG